MKPDNDSISRKIVSAAPPETDEATLERVASAARGRAERSPSTQRRSRRWTWPALASVTVAVVAVLAFMIAGRGPQLTVAFAEQDALAALKPAPGLALHLKTRTVAQNAGESEPIIDGSLYEEAWIDFDGDRMRTMTREMATDKIVSQGVQANNRIRYIADDPTTPEKLQIVFEQAAPEPVGALTFWAYSFLPDRLTEGEVVGEVMHRGVRCWDVRWEDSADTAGNKMSARALFRQPDYVPMLVERDYSGGAVEEWDVLAWETIEVGKVPADTFDPSTIGDGTIPELKLWSADELSDHADHPVYWAGSKLGEREIMAVYTQGVSGQVTPVFVQHLRVIKPIDAMFADGRVAAEYVLMDSEGPTMAVSSGPTLPAEELFRRLGAASGSGTFTQTESAIGTAQVAELADGGFMAAIAAGDAAVVVEAPDRESLDALLDKLELVR